MKKIVILCCVLFLTGCNFIGNDFDDNQMSFAVRRVLRQEGLDSSDYDQLKHLDLSYMSIESIEGIEVFKNLESLTLAGNLITDIEALSSLKSLRILDLQNNRVSDLKPLEALNELEILLIRNNPVDNLDALEHNFPNLKTTDFLVHVEFEDPKFEVLIKRLINKDDQITYRDLEQVRTLDFTDSGVTDISGIEHFSNLETLIIKDPVSNLSKLYKLSNLLSITLNNQKLSDAAIVKSFTQASYLDLSYNQISSIEDLSNLTRLEYLDISHNKIEELSPLVDLKKITTLYVNNNYLEDYLDIDALLDQIITTDIFIVYFNDLQLDHAVRASLGKEEGILSLNSLRSLKSLDASGYGIRELGGIEVLESLIELDLSENEILDVEPLSDLKNLQILKLSQNRIEDIQSFVYFDGLSILDLSYNQVSKIDPLLFINGLKYLYLQGNPIEESELNNELKQKLEITDEW